MHQQTERKQDSLEAELAAIGMEPLLRGVSAAALAARADRDGRHVHRQRNVGVGGGAVEMGANSEVRVDGADVSQQWGVVRKPPAGTRADLLDLGGEAPSGGAAVLDLESPLDATGEQGRDLVQLGAVLGADVDFGAGLGGNRVDAGAAFENSEVV